MDTMRYLNGMELELPEPRKQETPELRTADIPCRGYLVVYRGPETTIEDLVCLLMRGGMGLVQAEQCAYMVYHNGRCTVHVGDYHKMKQYHPHSYRDCEGLENQLFQLYLPYGTP